MHRNLLATNAPFSPSIQLNARLFAVSHDAKYIFSGGHWDWSLCVYCLVKWETIGSIIYHTDIITCLTLDSTGYILVTGSKDKTCVIWYLTLNDNKDRTLLITPERILYGHRSEITCVCVSSELDLVVSGSFDGTCNIYTIEDGTYIRTIRPTSINNDSIINLKLSNERHILVQTKDKDTHLFLYSINGCLICTKRFEYDIVDILLSDQCIILAINYDITSREKTDLKSLVAGRVVIKNVFE